MSDGVLADARAAATAAEERLSRFMDLQDLLFRFSSAIGPGTELQPLLERVLGAMRELIAFKGGSICLADDGLIRIVAADPPVSPEVLAARLPVGEGLAGRVVATGQAVYSPDLRADARVDQALAKLGSNSTIRSYLAVPLVTLGQTIGVLQVDSAEVDAYSPDDRYVLAGLATQVAGAIESARRYEAIAELERLKRNFMLRVNHELRTPIAILRGFSDLLRSEFDENDDRRTTYVERIDNAGRSLHYLVEEILVLTELDASGSGPLVSEPIEVGLAVDAVCTQLEVDPVPFDGAGDLVTFTQRDRLHIILRALVSNALAYARDVRVEAELVPHGRRPWCHVRVVDRGDGVPEEARPGLFEEFARGFHENAGMGLGLPTARAVARSLGGDLTYAPRDGGGSVFTLSLPHERGETGAADD